MALSVSVWLDSSESRVLHCCGIFCLLFRKCSSIQNIYANKKANVMKDKLSIFRTLSHISQRTVTLVTGINSWIAILETEQLVCVIRIMVFIFLFIYSVSVLKESQFFERCVFSLEALAAYLFQWKVWKHQSFCLISEYFHKNAYLKSRELMGKVWLNSDQVGMLRQTWREGGFIRHLPL